MTKISIHNVVFSATCVIRIRRLGEIPSSIKQFPPKPNSETLNVK